MPSIPGPYTTNKSGIRDDGTTDEAGNPIEKPRKVNVDKDDGFSANIGGGGSSRPVKPGSVKRYEPL